PGGKRPHRIFLAGRRPFTLARLWERRRRGDEARETCAVGAAHARRAMAPLDDRVPVILAPTAGHARLELDAGTAAPGPLRRPYEREDRESDEGSTRVNRPANDTPECIEPVDPPLTLL